MKGLLRRYCVLPKYTLFPREIFRRDEEDRRQRCRRHRRGGLTKYPAEKIRGTAGVVRGLCGLRQGKQRLAFGPDALEVARVQCQEPFSARSPSRSGDQGVVHSAAGNAQLGQALDGGLVVGYGERNNLCDLTDIRQNQTERRVRRETWAEGERRQDPIELGDRVAGHQHLQLFRLCALEPDQRALMHGVWLDGGGDQHRGIEEDSQLLLRAPPTRFARSPRCFLTASTRSPAGSPEKTRTPPFIRVGGRSRRGVRSISSSLSSTRRTDPGSRPRPSRTSLGITTRPNRSTVISMHASDGIIPWQKAKRRAMPRQPPLTSQSPVRRLRGV